MRSFADAQACDLRRARRLVPRAARARRLPAAVPVRGLVPVAGAHGRAARAHGRGRRGGVRVPACLRSRVCVRVPIGGRRMSAADERTGEDALARLRALLRREGGLMATLVEPAAAAAAADAPAARNGLHASPGSIAATGRARPAGARSTSCWWRRSTRATCCTTGRPRVVRMPEADLKLLAGDRLYAIGLARLVALGDTLAVAELADTITLSALAQGAGASELADAVWAAGARAVGWGSSEAHARAKDLVLAGAPNAIEAMRTSSTGRRRVALNRASVFFAPGARQARQAQVQVHARPGDARGVRGRDDHAPPVHDRHRPRRRSGRGSVVRAARARLRDRPDLQKQPAPLGSRGQRSTSSPTTTTSRS